jgi:hypothetical protein
MRPWWRGNVAQKVRENLSMKVTLELDPKDECARYRRHMGASICKAPRVLALWENRKAGPTGEKGVWEVG